MSILSLPPSSASPTLDAPLEGLPDATGLIDACLEAIRSAPSDPLLAVLEGVGAPTRELLGSPFSARASALGVVEGCAFHHHEVRERIPMPEELEPEIAVWDGATVPAWRDGVLAEPKYFSFFQDAPLPSFNPNHRGKWRSHELLHAANGFFWHPTMTRFEFYLGARLAELLPVVHWYALDEAFRGRCAEHVGQAPPRQVCLACEAAAVPFDERGLEAEREQAIGWIGRGYEHLAAEWGACAEELRTGRPVSSPRGALDASSDAIGYLRGHFNRVTAWSFGRWVERFLVAGEDYHDDLAGYARHILEVAHRLLTGTIAPDPERIRRLRARRILRDVGYRLLLAAEHLPENTDIEAIELALDEASEASHALRVPGTTIPRLWDLVDRMIEAPRKLRARKPPTEVFRAIGSLGYVCDALLTVTPQPRPPFAAPAAKFLGEGLVDACPQTMNRVVEVAVVAEAFASSEAFGRSGTLAGRFAAWLQAPSPGVEVAPLTAELAAFEAWTRQPPHQDELAETFASIPPDDGALRGPLSRLRANLTLRRMTVSPQLARLLTTGDETREITLIAARLNGTARILVLNDIVESIIENTNRGTLPSEWISDEVAPTVFEMLDHGILIWEPAPAGV